MNRDPNLNSTQDTYLSIINRSGKHLLELINDVLDMAKIEAGRMSLNISSFNLKSTLETIEEIFILKAAEKQLELEFLIQDSVPKIIKSDEKKLRQILLNLLGNSIKFTDSGLVRLLVEVVEKNNEEYILSFTVEDTGDGIKDTEISSLFTAFIQTESGLKSNQGTGLGLPISRKFVQMMGGDIFVTSQVGQGTAFRFTIAVQESQDTIAIAPETPPKVIGLAPNQKTFKVLIVDDQWVNRKLLEQLLAGIGFEIQEAENGREAIAVWESWQPHLIWTDIRMPILDGYELSREIRQREQQCNIDTSSKQRTIILAITASILKEEEDKIAESGCDGFVRKPFQENEILTLMQDFLQVRYLYEEKRNSIPPSTKQPSPINNSDLRIQLEKIPGEWREELKRNVIVGDDQKIFLLLEELPDSARCLKQILKDWTEEFRFDLIQDLLK